MGEDGFFRREMKKIMKRYPAKQFREDFNALKEAGAQPGAGDLGNVHNLIRILQNQAKIRAEAQLPELMKQKEQEAREGKLRQAATRANDAEAFLRTMEQFSR